MKCDTAILTIQPSFFDSILQLPVTVFSERKKKETFASLNSKREYLFRALLTSVQSYSSTFTSSVGWLIRCFYNYLAKLCFGISYFSSICWIFYHSNCFRSRQRRLVRFFKKKKKKIFFVMLVSLVCLNVNVVLAEAGVRVYCWRSSRDVVVSQVHICFPLFWSICLVTVTFHEVHVITV